MESPSPISSETQFISRSPAISRTLQVLLVAFTELLAQAAHAHDDTPSMAEMPKKTYVSPTKELRDTQNRAFPLLDDPDSLVRHQTQKQIQDAIKQALLRKNPIADQDLLMKVTGSAEQKARIRRLNDFALYQKGAMPRLLHNESDAALLLRSELSRVWQMPVISTADEHPLQEALLKPGESVQTLEALKTICHQTGCIPRLSSVGITLIPAQEDESIWTDGKIFWVRKEGEERPSYELFASPDYASIAQIEKISHFGKESAHLKIGTIAQKWEGQQSTPQPKRNNPIEGNAARVSLLIKPITGTIIISKKEMFELGPQKITVYQPEKKGDIWHTKITGGNYADVPWPATTTLEDTRLYEVTANNRFTAKDTQGKMLYTEVTGLKFTLRNFECTLQTSEEPSSIDVASFDTFKLEELELPKKDVMEKIMPRQREK